MEYIDLFAGVGGFRKGIENATVKAQCVYSNEWNKYANSVYRRHYGECDQRDIRTVTASQLPDFELLCAGFPCQSFSIAGKRGGFDDTRGTMFFEIERILDEKKPRLCLLENVKGLLSHADGRTFKTIIASLDELGYDVEWQVINSKNYGVAQNRERVFIIGHLRGMSSGKVFPLTRGDDEDNEADTEMIYWKNSKEKWVEEKRNCTPVLKTHTDYVRQPLIKVVGMLNDEKWSRFNESSRRVYDTEGIAPTVPTVAGGGHTPKILAVQDIRGMKKKQNGKGFKENESYTLDSLATQGVLKDLRIRRLTPMECERLQGFPDNYTKYGADGEVMSDGQRYKMMGNAVTITVITEIAKELLK
jgi:DNA (cytosine-5)-methyltransferase 1